MQEQLALQQVLARRFDDYPRQDKARILADLAHSRMLQDLADQQGAAATEQVQRLKVSAMAVARAMDDPALSHGKPPFSWDNLRPQERTDRLRVVHAWAEREYFLHADRPEEEKRSMWGLARGAQVAANRLEERERSR